MPVAHECASWPAKRMSSRSPGELPEAIQSIHFNQNGSCNSYNGAAFTSGASMGREQTRGRCAAPARAARAACGPRLPQACTSLARGRPRQQHTRFSTVVSAMFVRASDVRKAEWGVMNTCATGGSTGAGWAGGGARACRQARAPACGVPHRSCRAARWTRRNSSGGQPSPAHLRHVDQLLKAAVPVLHALLQAGRAHRTINL